MGTQIWIDYGRRWSADFTVVLPWYSEPNLASVRRWIRDDIRVVVLDRDDPYTDEHVISFDLEARGDHARILLHDDTDEPDDRYYDMACAVEVLKPGRYPVVMVRHEPVDILEVS